MAGQKVLTYSFLDVHGTFTGPGGFASIGSGSGIAEEGISIEMSEETDSMLIGADGSVAHSLHASRAGKITLRVLKTSPLNALLMQIYNFQRESSLNFGQNVIAVANVVTGDAYVGTQAAFTRLPNNAFAKTAGTIDWEFNCGRIDVTLGGAGLLIA